MLLETGEQKIKQWVFSKQRGIMNRPFDQAPYQVIKEMMGGGSRIFRRKWQHQGGQKCAQGKFENSFGQQFGTFIHITIFRSKKSAPYDKTVALKFNISKHTISRPGEIFPKILANDEKKSKYFFYLRMLQKAS